MKLKANNKRSRFFSAVRIWLGRLGNTDRDKRDPIQLCNRVFKFMKADYIDQIGGELLGNLILSDWFVFIFVRQAQRLEKGKWRLKVRHRQIRSTQCVSSALTQTGIFWVNEFQPSDFKRSQSSPCLWYRRPFNISVDLVYTNLQIYRMVNIH